MYNIFDKVNKSGLNVKKYKNLGDVLYSGYKRSDFIKRKKQKTQINTTDDESNLALIAVSLIISFCLLESRKFSFGPLLLTDLQVIYPLFTQLHFATRFEALFC